MQKDYEGVQMKSSREQFEEWYSKASGLCDMDLESEFNVDDNGEYIYSGARDAWAAWQASRAAIEVELPDKVMVEDEFDNGHNCAIDYCADAIRAAGLTVKGES